MARKHTLPRAPAARRSGAGDRWGTARDPRRLGQRGGTGLFANRSGAVRRGYLHLVVEVRLRDLRLEILNRDRALSARPEQSLPQPKAKTRGDQAEARQRGQPRQIGASLTSDRQHRRRLHRAWDVRGNGRNHTSRWRRRRQHPRSGARCRPQDTRAVIRSRAEDARIVSAARDRAEAQSRPGAST